MGRKAFANSGKEAYEKMLTPFSQSINPKPSWEQREKLLAGYDAAREASAKSKRMLKGLNAELIGEVLK